MHLSPLCHPPGFRCLGARQHLHSSTQVTAMGARGPLGDKHCDHFNRSATVFSRVFCLTAGTTCGDSAALWL